MQDYVTLFDDYSIQFNKTLEYGCGGDWDRPLETAGGYV